jgi:hypothetical protein
MVRFAGNLPTYRDGRKTQPGSARWTWGRRWQQPYGSSFDRWGQAPPSPDEIHPLELAYEADKLALQAHMTAVWYTDYVDAGCMGPAPRELPDRADPWVERTHRRWCPLEKLSMSTQHGGMPMFPRPIHTRGAPTCSATCVSQRTP